MFYDEVQKHAPVKVKLYRHQAEAFMMTMDKFGTFSGAPPESEGMAYLFEMGTGKTLTSIASIGCMYQHGMIERVLIVAPLTILPVWEEELRKFADFPYTATVLTGTMEKKRQQLGNLPVGGLQIVIVNYESAWRLKPELLAFKPDLIACDEGHRLKEGRSKQSKAMHELGDRARFKLLLTGTPITNHEIDIWSEYRFLNPGIFGSSFYAFRNRFFTMGGYGLHTPIFRKLTLPEFTERLHSIAYRCRKEECLDLPEITEIIHTVDLEPEARKVYERIRDESYAEIKDKEITAANVLTRMLRLSQITGGNITVDDTVVRNVSHAKMDALEELVDTAIAEEQKLVIMAHFVPELDAIEEMLKKKGIQYSVVRGGIRDRGEQVERFQKNPECRIFVGQLQAAGEGITLTAASTMVFYSLDYSMSHFEQAKARIHRSGQSRPCSYIFLTCRHTVDQKVIKALQEKKDLAQLLIDDYRMGHNPFSDGR